MKRRVVVRATGHPALRGGHAKTVELIRGTDVTPRATCIVGVRADLDPTALGLLRGEVTVGLSVSGEQIAGTAIINPYHDVSDRLVIRRSKHMTPETLAIGSTLTAADLTPAMSAALADPDSKIALTVAENEPAPPLLIINDDRLARPSGRLRVLWQHADQSVRLAAAPTTFVPGIIAASYSGAWTDLPAGALTWLAQAASHRARFVVVGNVDGLVATLLAAGLPPASGAWLGRLDRRTVRSPGVAHLLSDPPVPTIVTLPVGVAAEVAAAHDSVAIREDRLDLGVAASWVSGSQLPAHLVGRPDHEITVILPARDSAGDLVSLAAVIRALAEAGISPRTVSEALKPLGIDRRRVYAVMGKELDK